jgi:galactokinase
MTGGDGHESVVDAFVVLTGQQPEGVWSSPGRVNLIGEHTDYNDGFALPFAIESRAYVAARRRDDGVLRMRSVQLPDGDMTVPVDDLHPGTPKGWGAYVAGVVWAARQTGHPVGGMDVLVDGRVPLGSGLSSSHALECAVAAAATDLHGVEVTHNDLARLSLAAENDFVGAPTGMMDQLASLRCTAGHAIFLDNRTLDVEQVPLDVDVAGLALVVLDTRVHHDHAEGGYGDRRASCERAAGLLGVPALRDVDPVGLDAALARLPDDELRRRVRHVVTEDVRVVDAVAALRAGDWPALGALMDASHESLRDDYEVSCEELDVAVDAARDAGALGARMTGGGFGGCVIALVPDGTVADVDRAVTSAFASHGWGRPRVVEVTPSQGASRDA